ncbi:MAG: protease inhibitor I42 family protein [SAR202 cluster bacterium]|nr:hypothetical protein [Chloroflexota bacterium]MDP6422809.1 protease inhibitor I42 family protein [SAR202 cluster bacterium]HAL47821.1 hypothetical protein [Dehalococcoidia bacterium]MDP6665300.1 protease inhibitor I42 family protein [SAR202 cluster bacterium]MDP6799018.1 protease inhibitor I42 family protein [SAR202 cluster bacterium]
MNKKLTATAFVAIALVAGGIAGSLASLASNGSDDDGASDQTVAAKTIPVATPAPAIPLGAPENGAAVIEIRVGESHTVSLESNITTGYSWEIGPEFDGSSMELVEQRYEQATPGSNLPGAGGVEHYTFRALAFGTAELSLDYRRPWEDEAIESARYVFHVGVSESLADEMTQAEARLIAASSDCAEAGALMGEANTHYNDWSGTWWIDLEVNDPASRPACVIDAATGHAEVNWRMTGLKPPPVAATQ